MNSDDFIVPYLGEDPGIEQAANLYEKLKPHRIVVPLRYENEYGWIPDHQIRKFLENAERAYDYLCSRGDGVNDSGRFDAPKIMSNQLGMIAILWEPRLKGFSPPTFEQFYRLLKNRI